MSERRTVFGRRNRRRWGSPFILLPAALSLGCGLISTPTPEEPPPPEIGAEGEAMPLVCDTSNGEALAAYNRGNTQEENGRIQAAIVSYREAVELDPGFCDAMDNLGLMLRREGEIDEAIEWYRKSLAIAAENPVALMNLGAALKMQGDLEAAEEAYTALAEVDPENPEGHYGLGVLHLDLDSPDEAIAHLTIAKDLYHASASAWEADADYQLGIAYALADDCASALAYFEPLYPSNQDNAELNWYMGVCYLAPESEDLDLARKHLLEAERLGIVVPPELMLTIEAGESTPNAP